MLLEFLFCYYNVSADIFYSLFLGVQICKESEPIDEWILSLSNYDNDIFRNYWRLTSFLCSLGNKLWMKALGSKGRRVTVKLIWILPFRTNKEKGKHFLYRFLHKRKKSIFFTSIFFFFSISSSSWHDSVNSHPRIIQIFFSSCFRL